MAERTARETITFPCIELVQPIGTFYVGTIDAAELIAISYADIRRVEKRDVERYLGIQRPLSPKRVKEIAQYVHNIDATFPTSVIIAVESKNVVYDKRKRRMTVRKAPKVAKIIDGQHRLAGLEEYEGEETFQLNLTVFVDMDIENQAMVFATINLAQTRVSKSLVYDLYELTKSPSPQKTSHNIAKLLNSKESSPFFQRIKLLGRAIRKHQTLTQAAFVEALLEFISGDPLSAMRDRDKILRGEKLRRATDQEEKRLIFRNMFIDERDVEIAEVVWNYFSAVEQRWSNSWAGVDVPGNILPRTNGFRALMRFMRQVYLHLGGPGIVLEVEVFYRVFNNIELKDEWFTTERYKPGTSGETALYRDLMAESGIEDVR